MATQIYNEENYTFEHKLLIKKAIERSKFREAFEVFGGVPIDQKRASYKELDEELGTSYSDDRERSFEYEVNFETKYFSIPMVHAGYAIDPHEKSRKERGDADLNTTEERIMRRFGADMDMYAIAGEPTLNGVAGLSTIGTGATAQLDLTTIATMRTTFNGILNQYNDLLNNSDGDQTLGDIKSTIMLTTDVSNRMFALGSSLDDFVDLQKVFLDIAERRLKELRVVVTNNLGATVSKKGRKFFVSTPGTTNFAIFPREAEYNAVFESSHIISEKDDYMDGFRRLHEHRLVRADFQAANTINSNTVDITS